MIFIKKTRKIFTALIMLLALFSNANANSIPTIDLILPSKSKKLQLFSALISAPSIYKVNTYFNELPDKSKKGDIIVVISNDLISILKKSNYQNKIAVYIDDSNSEIPNNIYKIYSRQPLIRQIALIEAIYKDKNLKISVPFNNKKYRDEIVKTEKYFPQINFSYKEITEENNIREINIFSQYSNVLLATPETYIYNYKSARAILLGSYRHNLAVIGTSSSIVDAGALATVTSDLEMYANDAINLITNIINNKTVDHESYPSNYLIKINHKISESLGIFNLDESSIKMYIEKKLANEKK